MTAGKLVQHKVEELELEGLPWSHYSIYWSTVHVPYTRDNKIKYQ